ncbi:hypothetical protein [Actibacterium sp. 188UL27-1]|uniref:DUF6985 domain-containing protein n=1 Tax=Actibacterium sp. 188UL27-1 TaxID=2786961 RepID=UPI00195E7075|nr:hypothetical protein [Actibacterium sp. 188UL27-1]MBM7069120.1 hypothetical protein [Actibacterium sp. 188UL27-1]
MTVLDQIMANPASGSGALPVPFFDDAVLPLDWEGRSDGPGLGPALAATLAAFRRLTPADRGPVGRHIMAYHDEVQDVMGGEAIENGDPPAKGPEDVWRLVEPRRLTLVVDPIFGDITPYIMVTGECAWDPEHGFLLSWARGRHLIRVAPADYRPTHGSAMAKLRGTDYIYYSAMEKFRTRRD